MSHRNAPLTPTGRLLLCQRIEAGWAIAHAADAMGISRQCAHKWWRRYEELGSEGLCDRSSRPRRSPGQTTASLERRILTRRRIDKLGPHRIGGQLGVPPSTVYRVLVRNDMGRLDHFDRATGREIRPYERERPGELVHVDIKKLGKIPSGGGHRHHGRGKVRQRRPGGTQLRLSAARAGVVLRSVRPTNAVDVERKRMALGHVADIRRLDAEIAASKARIVTAVAVSGTSVTELYGVGPVVAAFLIGHSGDMARFAHRDHYASYTPRLPSKPRAGRGCDTDSTPRGNRRLNYAIHVIAICQIRHPTGGRRYFDRKAAEGKTSKEALRALKRQISNGVYRQLVFDSSR